MVKRDVSIDEEWPVFTLDEPKRDGPFCVELSDDEYKEYLWIMYKYRQWQIKLQGLYESAQRDYNGTNCGSSVPEGVEPYQEYKWTIRESDVTKAQV